MCGRQPAPIHRADWTTVTRTQGALFDVKTTPNRCSSRRAAGRIAGATGAIRLAPRAYSTRSLLFLTTLQDHPGCREPIGQHPASSDPGAIRNRKRHPHAQRVRQVNQIDSGTGVCIEAMASAMAAKVPRQWDKAIRTNFSWPARYAPLRQSGPGSPHRDRRASAG